MKVDQGKELIKHFILFKNGHTGRHNRLRKNQVMVKHTHIYILQAVSQDYRLVAVIYFTSSSSRRVKAVSSSQALTLVDLSSTLKLSSYRKKSRGSSLS